MRRRSNSGVAYDHRTGARVEGRRLRQDYYTRGWTEDADEQHPQDLVRAPGPDGRRWSHGAPSQDSIPATYAWGKLDWRDPTRYGLGQFSFSLGAFLGAVGAEIEITPPAAMAIVPPAFEAELSL